MQYKAGRIAAGNNSDGPDADRTGITKSVDLTPAPRKSLRRKEIVVGEEGLEPSSPYGKRILSPKNGLFSYQ